MPPLDREPRPWSSPSSNPSAARSRAPPMFPSLKRVRRNSAAGETAAKAGIKPTSDSSHVSPSDLFDAPPPVPEKSALLDTVEQLCMLDTAPGEVDNHTAITIVQNSDGQPLWPSTPKEPSPSSPPPTSKAALPSQQPISKASQALTAKASKGPSAEKRRQARNTEDDRLVEDARRSAAELVQRVRQTRPEDRARTERLSRQKDRMIQGIRESEKTATTRASIRKGGQPSGILSGGKKTSPSVERGRNLEREISRRRDLGMTDSPKPHVGGKSSVVTKGMKSKTTPSTKVRSAPVPVHFRASTRPSYEVASRTTTATSKATLPKQRSMVVTKDVQSLKETTALKKVARSLDESVARRRAERKLATASSPAQRRALPPSSEEFVVITDGQKATLGQEDTTSNMPLSEKSNFVESPRYSSAIATDHFQDLGKTDKAACIARPIQDQSRSRDSSGNTPVYRPKTRRPITGPRQNSSRPVSKDELEKQYRILSAQLLRSEEQSQRRGSLGQPTANQLTAPSARIKEISEHKSIGTPLAMNTPSAGPLQPTVNSENSNQVYNNGIDALSGAFELGHEEFDAEQMSPIDLGKVPSLHPTSPDSPPPEVAKDRFSEWKRKISTPEYPWSSKGDIGGPLELRHGQAELLRKPLEEKEGKAEKDSLLDAQIKSLMEFHSKVCIDPVPFDSTLKLDKLALDFQPRDASPRHISPANRPIKEVKHKRKGIKTVQWNVDLPIRLKNETPQTGTPENVSRKASGTSDEKSKAENSNGRNSREVSGDLLNLSSSAKLQPMPLSCLTNSHRGKRLHVSFAPPADDDLPETFITVDCESRVETKSACPVSSTEISHEDVEASAPPNLSTSSGRVGEPAASYNETGVASKAVPLVYRPEDYEKATRGFRKAIATGRLLLEPSYTASTTSVGQMSKIDGTARRPSFNQLDDAVTYILDVKKRFYYRPEIYSKFVELLETCRTEPITPDQAKHVDIQVAKLFADAPDLLQGFKRFRPARKDSEHASTVEGDTVYPTVVTSEVQDDKRDGISAKFPEDNKNLRENIDTQRHMQSSRRVDSMNKLVASLRDSARVSSARVSSIDRLVGSLRDSARALGKQPDQNKPPVVSGSMKGSLKFDPEAPVFRPLSKAFGTVPRRSLSNGFTPAFQRNQTTGISTSKQNDQPRSHGINENPDSIFVRENANGELHAMGYLTMPTRANKYYQALKKDLATVDNPQPIVLEKPVAVNGTTYYSMPKHGLPVNAATSLPSGFRKNQRKDCRFAFSNSNTSSYGGSFASVPRGPRFAQDNHTDPLWMHTPLVPIRKGCASEAMTSEAPFAPKRDLNEDCGMEAQRLDDHIAKMKLDDFMSRFPMTGRKAQVVTNMKQKYAAEIQHRLELVLYEKKEKEAAARKLSVPGEA